VLKSCDTWTSRDLSMKEHKRITRRRSKTDARIETKILLDLDPNKVVQRPKCLEASEQ
jgi:hypothetical protein